MELEGSKQQEQQTQKELDDIVLSASGTEQSEEAWLFDLLSLRAMLVGESVVDARYTPFVQRDQVDDFLRLCGFDTDSPVDLAHLGSVHLEATAYLTETHRLRLPQGLEQPLEVHDIFLASRDSEPRLRRYACMILKVMHIAHHIRGRELVYNTAISEAQLFGRLNAKVFSVIDRMRADGIAVQQFASGKKTRTSQITKLFAKRTTLATHIFDKLRFRIIVDQKNDLVGALRFLARHLFPYNYVMPGQSQNGILSVGDIAEVLGAPLKLAMDVMAVRSPSHFPQKDLGSRPEHEDNAFSGGTYRSINFVVDIPLRIDDFTEQSPSIAFVQAEIQLADVATLEENERGENAHALYKKRQRQQVRTRLEGFEADEELEPIETA